MVKLRKGNMSSNEPPDPFMSPSDSVPYTAAARTNGTRYQEETTSAGPRAPTGSTAIKAMNS
jgi:hypothetical protein